MVFVLNARYQRTSAFGVLNASEAQVGEDLRRVFNHAREEVRALATPTTRSFPLERLRRSIAHAMRLDVLYSQRVQKVHYNRKNPASKLPVKEDWEPTPVWKVATKLHYRKALKLSSLLHEIAVFGFRANIVHDLVRLSVHIWTLPWNGFCGLCRRILSRISKSVKLIRSSPDPTEQMGLLSVNPILRDRVYRHPAVLKGPRSFRVTPKKLVVLIAKLGERLRRLDAVRISVLRLRV